MIPKLDKILGLVRKTRDTFILADEKGSFAVMPLEKYEELLVGSGQHGDNLATLSQDELIGKINNDIAEWRLSQEGERDFSAYSSGKIANEEVDLTTEDQYYLEPVD